jgi:hypothetical protein
MIQYPRKVSSLGTERIPCAVAIQSKLNTCGVLAMGRRGGPDPNGPSVNNPAEFYIYLNSLTPMLGGVNEVMNNPAGGTALGAAVAAASFEPRAFRGTTVLGSSRVSSSVKICGPSFVSNNLRLPALGIMNTGGTKVTYLYVTEPGRFLCYGDEVAWQAGDATLKVAVAAAPASSGSLGNRRDGRTVFGNDDEGEAFVVESAGKSGAIILLSGDHTVGVALYIGATGAPIFDTAANWYTYTRS